MTYRGHVENGQITLDDPARLPEGTRVSIEVMEDGKVNDVVRDRHGILQLPLERRRQLLMEQSERLAVHYASEAERSDWQGGDIVE